MGWTLIVPSRRADNLLRSLGSLFATHASLDPGSVVVVDDGARLDAEARLPSAVRWVEGARPFVYARNVNLGAAAAMPWETLVLMGDDVEVLTPLGLDHLDGALRERPDVGIVSAAVRGMVGNPRQRDGLPEASAEEEDWLAFVCVAIRRSAWERVGPLDERFTGYGYEDVDYCRRVRATGLKLAVARRCVVRHDGSIPSTYRTRSDVRCLSAENAVLFRRKWDGHLCEPRACRTSN